MFLQLRYIKNTRETFELDYKILKDVYILIQIKDYLSNVNNIERKLIIDKSQFNKISK